MNWSGFDRLTKRGRGARFLYARPYARPGGRWIGRPTRRRGPNWPAILLVIAVIAAVALLVWGINALFGGGGEPSATPTPLPTPDALATPSPSPTPLVTPKPGESEEHAIIGGADARIVTSKEINMSQPGAYGNMLVYGAGSGSLSSEMVLTTLYQLDLDTGEETEIAKVSLRNSEITSTLVNERWIVWVESNYGAENLIRRYDRQSEDPETRIIDIKTVYDAVPQIFLYGDTLLMREQTDEGVDRILMADLTEGEDLSIARLTDPGSYGVSNPSIWGDQIIWAGRDPAQTQAEIAAGSEKSVIYYAEISKMGEYDTDEEGYIVCPYWKANMYVHQPVTNGVAWAWIDKNNAPDSSLWVYFDSKVIKVADGGVTSFGLASNHVVYGRDQIVWAYSLKDGTYTRLSGDSEVGALAPLVYGDRVVWITDPEGRHDAYKTVVLP